jgi:hypothetical protein
MIFGNRMVPSLSFLRKHNRIAVKDAATALLWFMSAYDRLDFVEKNGAAS